MREIYRKFGRVIRRENAVLVRADESGEAIEEGGTFSSAPIDDQCPLPEVSADAVNAAAGAIRDVVKPPVTIERLIVSEGAAFHEFQDRRWSDAARRIHVAMARPPYRALIDVAGFSTALIARVADALSCVDGERTLQRVRIAANVGASLLPSMIGQIAMQQWAAPHDGKGAWVENVEVTSGAAPNWFRPSYRSRPSRAWFHLRAEPKGEIDPDVAEAIAVLTGVPVAPPALRLLCLHRGAAFTAVVEPARLVAVHPTADWYPYAAGCFGAEMML